MLTLAFIALYASHLLLILFQCKKLEQSNQSRERHIAMMEQHTAMMEQHTAMMKKLLEQYKARR